MQLEKVLVPHWVRGEETAALDQFPGQAPGTDAKDYSHCAGRQRGHTAGRLEAEVIVARDFDELKSLGKEQVQGKSLSLIIPSTERWRPKDAAGEAYGEAVVYRSDAPSAAARLGAVAVMIRSVGGAAYRLPHTGADPLRR